MNELKIFENAEFGSVRTVMVDDTPYFVGKDVAEILGYTNPSKALADHVDEDDKLNNETLLSLGQRGGWLINESGLYSLILSSKLPNAKKFKHWVTSEVLPSIRHNGGYAPNLEELITKTAAAVASEVIKQVIPIIINNTGNSPNVPEEKTEITVKRFKYQTPSKISTLPPNIKEAVDDMILSATYSCQQIANFITESCGMQITSASVNRYAHNCFWDRK